MNFCKNDLDFLLFQFTGLDSISYRHLYFDLGSEWIENNAREVQLWGDAWFEGWWRLEWNKMASEFINYIRISADGNPFITLDGRSSDDKELIRACFERYALSHMMNSTPNQAVMELCLTAKMKLNQSKER